MKEEQLAAEVCAAAAKVSKRPVSVSVLTHLMAGDDRFPKARGELHAASSPEFLSKWNFFSTDCVNEVPVLDILLHKIYLISMLRIV
jgi:hypothetical protein